ncbi:MAG: CBS domain-containing protein [Clostridia bacterium]|nr:CBS domain-containing protein [Clostridia bacterium]
MNAEDIMIRDVLTISPEDGIEKVAKILVETGISGLPVVNEDGKVVGIITEGDLVYQQKKLNIPAYLNFLDILVPLGREEFLEDLKKMTAFKVEDLMTKDVIMVGKKTNITEIATLMVENKINRVPVVDQEQRLLGIITRHDIIKHIYTD